MKVIVSMATIPSRMSRLEENMPSILNQSYHFDTLIINILDDLSDDEYKFYEKIKKLDARITLNKCNKKWRSCNKLLPTLKSHPDDVIITIDDDIYYPVDCFKLLIEQYEKTPDCIIAHEINPLLLNNEKNYIDFINGYDIMLMQKEFGKYLSGCTLYPPHVFDDTDIFDYDKMMYCTNATHDELWFWVQSTLKNVKCVGLNYVRSFDPEVITPYQEDEFKLSSINIQPEINKKYMDAINEMYGEKLLTNILNHKIVFELNKDNVYSFLFLLPYINIIYSYGYVVKIDNLTKDWQNKVINAVKTKKNAGI